MIGVTIFILFLWRVARKLVCNISHAEKRNSLLFLLFAFISILFMGLFDHYWLTIQQGQLLFGFVIGLCLHEGNTVSRGTIQM